MSDERQPIVAVARIVIDLDREEEALAALAAVAEATHRDDRGCLLYAVTRDCEDPARITIVEKWESPAALEAHRGAAHSRAFRATSAITAVEGVSVLRQLGFGDPGKGAL